jgi:hypothetical protein
MCLRIQNCETHEYIPSAALSREQEKEAVVFAKEVRKANKLLTRLEEEASAQPSKLFAR